MIALYHWDGTLRTARWLSGEEWPGCDKALGAGDVVWIDLESPTPEEEYRVCAEYFPVHPLTLEDITRLRREPDSPPHFPKAEEFSDYLFVIANPLAPRFLTAVSKGETFRSGDGRASTQLSVILTHHLLITHHYEPLPSVQELRAFLSKHEAQAERGPDYLCHLILDSMVDQYAPVLDRIEDTLDQMEMQVFGKPTQELLLRILGLKHEIIVLRKTLVYEREVLARLSRGEFALIDAREMVYYRNVYDHVVRFTELIEAARDMVSDLMQSHLAATSNLLNQIMKALTMTSTLILPMTLIAGIYGMNFKRNMPELEWEFGYPFALSLMLVTGLGAFSLFKWRKWI